MNSMAHIVLPNGQTVETERAFSCRESMRVQGVFSGIGGLELGFERAGYEITGLCEIDRFCQRVLRRHWPDTDLFGDIRELRGVSADVIVGGFPCKGTSNAGPRDGLENKDSALWIEYLRVVGEGRPTWVVVENSSHGRKHWVPQVRRDLHELGYETTAVEVSAWDIGANHERRRCFVLANPGSGRCALAAEALQAGRESSQLHTWWASEPRIPRVDDGLPDRLDRRRALGNAVVPQVAEAIAWALRAAA